MADVDAGRLSLDVVADLSGFARDLQAKVDRAARDVRANIRAAVDSSALRREVQDAADRAAQGAQVTIRATLDYQQLRRDFQAAMVRLEDLARINIRATLDYQRLRRDVQAAILRLEQGLQIVVRVRADTSPLRDEIRRARVEAERNPIRLNILGDSGGGGAAALLGVVKKFLTPVAALALAGPAAGLVSALTGAVIALGGALAPLSGLLIAYPGLLAGVGQGFAAVKLGTSGLSEAIKAVDTQQTKAAASAAGLTVEQYKQRKAVRDLSAEQVVFARYLISLRDTVLPQLRASAAKGLLPGLQAGLRGLVTLLPQANKGLADSGKAIGDTARQGGRLVSSGPFREDFGKITSTNTYVVRQLGTAFVSLISLTRHLLVAGAPLIGQVARGIRAWAQYADASAKAGRESGRLQGFFTSAGATLNQLGRILRNVGIILYTVFSSGAPLGRDLLTTFEGLTAKGAAFVRSAAGIAKIKGYFESIRPALTEFGHLFGAVVGGVAKLGSQKGVSTFLAQLRTELGPSISALVSALQGSSGGFSSALVSTLKQFVDLATQLAANGGGLRLYLTIFGAIATALNAIIRNVPGMHNFLSVVIGLLVVTRVARAFSPLISAVRTLRTLMLGTYVQSFVRGLFGASTSAGGLAGVLNRVGRALRSAALAVRSFTAALLTQIRTMAVAAWGAFVSALSAIRTALVTATLASRAFAISLLTNPIFLVIAAIAALVVGFIALYKNVKPVREIMQAIGRGFLSFINLIYQKVLLPIGRFVRAFIGFFAHLYDVLLGHSIIPDIVNGIVRAFTVLGSIIRPILNVIVSIFKIAFTVISTIVRTEIAIIRTIITVGIAVVRTVISTALAVIKAIWNGAWAAVSFVIKLYWAIMTTIVRTYINTMLLVIRTVLTGIKVVWNAAWAAIRFVVAAVWNAIKIVVTTGINGVRFIIATVVNAIKTGWSGFWGFVRSTASTALDLVKRGISGALGVVQTAFRTAVEGIKRIWNGIKEVAAAPVRFVANTVYNHGIRAVWNKIAGFVHLPQLGELRLGFRRGGPVPHAPGSKPGKDSVAASLTPDEHVWTTDEVHAAGGHKAVAGLRAAVLGRGARVMAKVREGVAYAQTGGGVSGGGAYDPAARAEVQRLTHAAQTQTPIGALEQVGSAIVGYLRKGAANAASALLSPFKSLLHSAIPSSGFGKTIQALGTRLIDGVVSFIRGKERNDPPTGSTGGALNAAAKAVIKQALQILRLPLSWIPDEELLISRESGGNATVVNPTPVGREHATGFAQMLPSTFRANMLPGHTNILNALDNMLSSLRYQVRRWVSPDRIPGLHAKNYQGYARGGTVDPVHGGTLVRVAEAGRRETIVDTASLNAAVRERGATVVQHIYPSEHMDERELAALVDRELAWSSR